MSCSHVKPMPPKTWIAVPPSAANASLANAVASVAARWASAAIGVVGRPARVVARGAPQLDGAQHVGAQVLDRLERADRLVELHALLGVLDHHLQRARGGADTVDDVRDREPVDRAGDRAGHVRTGGAEAPAGGAAEADPCVLARAVDGLGRLRADAHVVTLHREHAHLAVVVGRGDEQETGGRTVGDVHLHAVDPPAVTVAPRRGRGFVPPVAAALLVERDGADRRAVGEAGEEEGVLARRARVEHE